MQLRTSLVTTDSELESLRPAWQQLWRAAAANASPFQSPDWLVPWWHHFGTGMPRVALLRHEDQLCGLLPLYILDDQAHRKLLPIGAGITDYLDILLHPDAPEGAAGMLLEQALATAIMDDVDVCDLTDLPQYAQLRQAATPAGWRSELRGTIACPVLTLPTEIESLAQHLPARTLRKLRMNRNRAARIGGFTTDVAKPSNIHACLESLFSLHQARWSEQGETGVLSDPRIMAFHREAAPALLADGLLRLQVLRQGEQIIAAFYTLLGQDSILFYLSGFDPRYAYESPGTILLGAMIEAAVREGRRELHFLRGAERYKRAWGGVDRFNAIRRLVPCTS